MIRNYSIDSQRVATYIFKVASLVFGVLGILIVLVLAGGGTSDSTLNESIFKAFWITVFVILPSFAWSIAGKYLEVKRENH